MSEELNLPHTRWVDYALVDLFRLKTSADYDAWFLVHGTRINLISVEAPPQYERIANAICDYSEGKWR